MKRLRKWWEKRKQSSPLSNGSQRRDEIGTQPNWTELPEECLLDILSRLSLEQRWVGPMMVCKTWMKTCQDPLVNSVFDLETSFSSKSFTIDWFDQEFQEKVDSILRKAVDWSQGGLKEIRVMYCTDQSVSYVAERCHNLEVLCIKSSDRVTDAPMMKLVLNSPKLRELDISNCGEISHEFWTVVCMNCPNLEILKRNQFSIHSPRPVYVADEIIVRLMPQLKHLELRYSLLGTQEINVICERCPNLEYLEVNGNENSHNYLEL